MSETKHNYLFKPSPKEFRDATKKLQDEYGVDTLVNPDSVTEIANLYPGTSAEQVAKECGLEEKFKRSQRWTPTKMEAKIAELERFVVE